MSVQTYAGTAGVIARLGTDSGFDAADLTLLTELCDQANDYLEQYMWRPVGPNAGGTATFDGFEDVSADGRTLYVREGIRTISSITVAPSTGATPVSGTAADFVILPRSQNRRPGWPGFEVRVKDTVTGSVSIFGHGFADIVIVGDFGWAAVPDSIVEVAEVLAVRMWHSRKAGQADIVGSEAGGEPLVSRYLSSRDKMLLRSFRPAGGLVVG